eukprot:gene10582-3101_t
MSSEPVRCDIDIMTVFFPPEENTGQEPMFLPIAKLLTYQKDNLYEYVVEVPKFSKNFQLLYTCNENKYYQFHTYIDGNYLGKQNIINQNRITKGTISDDCLYPFLFSNNTIVEDEKDQSQKYESSGLIEVSLNLVEYDYSEDFEMRGNTHENKFDKMNIQEENSKIHGVSTQLGNPLYLESTSKKRKRMVFKVLEKNVKIIKIKMLNQLNMIHLLKNLNLSYDDYEKVKFPHQIRILAAKKKPKKEEIIEIE